MAGRHAWWSKDLRSDLPRLAEDVRQMLEPEADLLRVVVGYEDWWWLSPAAARWTVLPKEQPVSGVPGGRVKEAGR